MSTITIGPDTTDPTYQQQQPTYRYYIDNTTVDATTKPCIYRQDGIGAGAPLWAWSKVERKWIQRKQGPDTIWRRIGSAEADWIIARRGIHLPASNKRQPRQGRP